MKHSTFRMGIFCSLQMILTFWWAEFYIECLIIKHRLFYWCWNWNSNPLAIWCKGVMATWGWLIGSFPWCWERLKVGGGWDDRGWDGWMASLDMGLSKLPEREDREDWCDALHRLQWVSHSWETEHHHQLFHHLQNTFCMWPGVTLNSVLIKFISSLELNLWSISSEFSKESKATVSLLFLLHEDCLSRCITKV